MRWRIKGGGSGIFLIFFDATSNKGLFRTMDLFDAKRITELAELYCRVNRTTHSLEKQVSAMETKYGLFKDTQIGLLYAFLASALTE